MSKMLPCPFCGGAPDAPWKSKTIGGWTIECNGCEMIVSPTVESEAEAIAAWNRRAPTPLETTAIAYVERDKLDAGMVDAWEAMCEAVKEYKKGQAK